MALILHVAPKSSFFTIYAQDADTKGQIDEPLDFPNPEEVLRALKTLPRLHGAGRWQWKLERAEAFDVPVTEAEWLALQRSVTGG